MSGRLTILPKKTYCPWKPENVERVLRDERLERERLEKEEQANRACNQERRQRVQRREGDETTTPPDAAGHVNLFPEAKEAELRLARGEATNNPNQKSQATNNNSNGILPIPLGGDEATKRKMGAIPFYMRPKNTSEEGKYHNSSGSFRLGSRYNGRDAAAADEITSKIMNYQYEKREDCRKDKRDPMSRFFGTDSSKSRISSKPTDAMIDYNGRKRSCPDMANNKRSRDEKHRKKYREKISHRSPDEDGNLSADSDSSSCCYSSSSGSSLRPDGSSTYSNNKANRHRRSRHSRKGAEHNSRSQDKLSSSHSVEPHPHKEPRRKHLKKSRRRRRHSHSSPSADRNNKESNEESSQQRTNELGELRKRRHAREAREMERERQVLLPPGSKSGAGFTYSDSEGRYLDQFNPTLSRN